MIHDIRFASRRGPLREFQRIGSGGGILNRRADARHIGAMTFARESALGADMMAPSNRDDCDAYLTQSGKHRVDKEKEQEQAGT